VSTLDPSLGFEATSVKIPQASKNSTAVFKSDKFEYRGKFFYYAHITGMYFNSMKYSVNFIPAYQMYEFGIISGKEKVNIQFTAPFYIGNKKMGEAYVRLIELAVHYIEPVLVAKMVKEIFDQGKTVKIDGIEFSSTGYRKKKLFGGYSEVLWTEPIYTPVFNEGYVHMFRDKAGKGVGFHSIPMKTENAVIIPSLVWACFNRLFPQNSAGTTQEGF